MSKELEGLAHEIWATAQLLPGEGIEDGVTRVEELLSDLYAGLRQIAIWSQEDQDDHELCAIQWRGCVAIARGLLGSGYGSGSKKGRE